MKIGEQKKEALANEKKKVMITSTTHHTHHTHATHSHSHTTNRFQNISCYPTSPTLLLTSHPHIRTLCRLDTWLPFMRAGWPEQL